MTAFRAEALDGGQLGSRTPKRISFNFADRCNMSCAFCYVPFDGARVQSSTAFEVIDAIMRWRPSSITVGGGDPLMYSFTPSLIDRIRRADHGDRTFVQLDSNLLRSTRRNLPALAGSIDMLGVPIDTFNATIALQMRSDARLPGELRRVIPDLVGEGYRIKVNTVVAAPNVHCLTDIADFVADSGVRAWSLYEFWAVGPTAIRNQADFALDHQLFLAAAAAARSRAGLGAVELGTVSSRQSAYFFVTPSGRAYTVDGADSTRYVELGNILDDEERVIQRWHLHANAAVNEARVRARMSWAERPTQPSPEPARI